MTMAEACRGVENKAMMELITFEEAIATCKRAQLQSASWLERAKEFYQEEPSVELQSVGKMLVARPEFMERDGALTYPQNARDIAERKFIVSTLVRDAPAMQGVQEMGRAYKNVIDTVKAVYAAMPKRVAPEVGPMVPEPAPPPPAEDRGHVREQRIFERKLESLSEKLSVIKRYTNKGATDVMMEEQLEMALEKLNSAQKLRDDLFFEAEEATRVTMMTIRWRDDRGEWQTERQNTAECIAVSKEKVLARREALKRER